jgi:hypothetical protein
MHASASRLKPVISNVRAMAQLLSILIDYAAIIVACVAASVSIVNLVWSTRLNEGRDRRKVLWERELNRFSELEDIAGHLVENLLSYSIRSEQERSSALEKLQILQGVTGRFLRYPEIASALRDVSHSAGWYISQDTKHETKIEFGRQEAMSPRVSINLSSP